MGRKRHKKHGPAQGRAAEPTGAVEGGAHQSSAPARSSRVWVAVAVLLALAGGSVLLWRSPAASQASPGEVAGAGSASAAAAAAAPGAASATEPDVRLRRVEVLRELSHERDAYTQGLVWWDGVLFESTGREGESTLRRLDPRTGRVEQRIDIPPQYFGEGLSLVDRRLIMLTWRAQRAFSYDRDSFELLDTYRYRGEGWGLCYDGDRLVMSDGSDRLTFRDPVTFEPIGEQRVRLRGQPLHELNELECVDGAVYANVWQTDFIVRIDPGSGRVTDYIDAAGLLRGADRLGAEVLNGIAWDPGADTFYITGKWWPKMFEVRFVEVE